MKNKAISIILTFMLVAALAACGKNDPKTQTGADSNNTVSTETVTAKATIDLTTDVPTQEAHEPSIDISDCDTFTQIVDKLPDGMGYANLSLYDNDVLLVSSGTYDNGDGTMAAIDAEIFAYTPAGDIVYLGYIEAGGTAYPLSTIDGRLLCGGNHFISSYGVKDGKLYLIENIIEQYDTDGNATYYLNSGDGNDHSDDSQEDIMNQFNDYYALFEEATVIDFQPVGGVVGMSNPWRPSDEEEATQLCPRLFKAPEEAKNVSWNVMESSSANESALVEMNFDLGDEQPLSLTARAQMGATDDISGLYYDWTVSENCTLNNWGGGNMKATTYRYISDTEAVDLITWYDVEIGIAYSLSTCTDSVDKIDGFDIQAVAESMFCEENDPTHGMPADFVQEQSGKTEFDSYDDVIANLKKDQGYTYIKLTGADDELLGVTDTLYAPDNTSDCIAIYAMKDGKAVNIGNVFSSGEDYPLRYEDGIIYAGDAHDYESCFVSKEYGGIMTKDYIAVEVTANGNTYSGFMRESNDFDHDTEFTGGKEEFDKLYNERERKAPIIFEKVN
ncbi:MAG: hypothetical protein II799_02810 [Lachnospiraceae bacterium]|nr:hypothetical protein [Lachnospiraceae bacterium]